MTQMPSDRLVSTRFRIANPNNCNEAIVDASPPTSEFCAMPKTSVNLALDTGSPLACREADGSWRIFGLFSNPAHNFNTVWFTDVGFYLDWIERTIDEKQYELPLPELANPRVSKENYRVPTCGKNAGGACHAQKCGRTGDGLVDPFDLRRQDYRESFFSPQPFFDLLDGLQRTDSVTDAQLEALQGQVRRPYKAPDGSRGR